MQQNTHHYNMEYRDRGAEMDSIWGLIIGMIIVLGLLAGL
jgi:hypothetical protein